MNEFVFKGTSTHKGHSVTENLTKRGPLSLLKKSDQALSFEVKEENEGE